MARTSPAHDRQPAVACRLGEPLVAGDARLGPSHERRRSVHAQHAGHSPVQQRREEAPRSTAEIEDRAPGPARQLAVEGEVLDHLVVLEVVELGQPVLVRGLRAEDVGAHAAT